MTVLEGIATFVKFAVLYEPQIEAALTKVFDLFKQLHPDIGNPPPVDEEEKINAEIDAQVDTDRAP